MSISNAIKNKDFKELAKTVEQALKVYSAGPIAEPLVDTVYGALPVSAIWDDETKWQLVGCEYAEILQKLAKLPQSADANVETAKLIATNHVLRHLVASGSLTNALL